ncbi:1-phosphatidylinositol-4,5-bisphosphate phosphodiesterase gamma-2 [Verticillium dahliae VDG1]|nr:1-phosphatidylinositol-4,5-bisphosphate phosphodiesterase gamma-2 [Verticillium dahliae VDG1]
MTSIGPQMPPSPSKRKRTPDNQEDESPPTKQARNTDEIDINDDDSSDDGFGPSAPAAQGSSASKTAAGPSLPPTAKTITDEIDLDASDNDDDDDDGPSASSAATTASASKPGKSLYETHATARKEGGRRKDDEEEDDPSARAFDREKDMALGGRINSTQRRELLGKAKDFGGRFQKGSFL